MVIDIADIDSADRFVILPQTNGQLQLISVFLSAHELRYHFLVVPSGVNRKKTGNCGLCFPLREAAAVIKGTLSQINPRHLNLLHCDITFLFS